MRRLLLCGLLALGWPPPLAAEDLSRIHLPDNLEVVWQGIFAPISEAEFLNSCTVASGPTAMIDLTDGDVFVAGATYDGCDGIGRRWAMRIDGFGNERWRWRASETEPTFRGNFGVAVETKDHQIVVYNNLRDSGMTWSDVPLFATVFSADGKLLRSVPLDIETGDFERKVVLRANGGKIVIVQPRNDCSAAELALTVVDPDGEERWSVRIPRRDGTQAWIRSVLGMQEGMTVRGYRIDCTDVPRDHSNAAYFIVRYDVTGKELWRHDFPVTLDSLRPKGMIELEAGATAVLIGPEPGWPSQYRKYEVVFYDGRGDRMAYHALPLAEGDSVFGMLLLTSDTVLLYGIDDPRKSGWIGTVHRTRGFGERIEILGLRAINEAVLSSDGNVILAGSVLPTVDWSERTAGNGTTRLESRRVGFDLWLAKVKPR